MFPPTGPLFFGTYTVTRKAVELAVDLSKNEELMQLWYLHVDQLPILRHMNILCALLGLPVWIHDLVFTLPKALRGHFGLVMGVLRCVPLVGITAMVVHSIEVKSLAAPGKVPNVELQERALQLRVLLLGTACTMLAGCIVQWHVATWGVRRGIRQAVGGPSKATSSSSDGLEEAVEGVPDGMEIATLTEPGLVEMAAKFSAFWLCMFDLGIGLGGHEELIRKWLEHRSSLPVVRHVVVLMAVATLTKLLSVLAYTLPEALGGVPGSRAGSVLLVLAPALVCLSHLADEAATPKATAMAKVFLVAVALWGHGAEIVIRNRGITSGVRLSSTAACKLDKRD